MGWKSTLNITRQEAIWAIEEAKKLKECPYTDYSNEELEEVMESYRIGDIPTLPYFGHNFIIKEE